MVTRVTATMPDGRTPRSPGWQIGVAGLSVIALVVGVRMAISAAEYDVDGIGEWLAAIAGELVLASALLQARTTTTLGTRSLVLVMVAMLMLVPIGWGEAPRHWTPFQDHETWVVFAGMWSLVFCVGMTIHYWIGRFRRRGHVQSAP